MLLFLGDVGEEQMEKNTEMLAVLGHLSDWRDFVLTRQLAKLKPSFPSAC